MILSVYDYDARLFHYYEIPGNPPRATRYRALNQKPQGSPQLGGIGYAPEALGVPLPAGAQKIGTGREARGVVAFRGNAPWRAPVATAPSTSVGGLGADAVVEVEAKPVSFGHVVAAACIASVVGVFVQKALK